MYGSYTDDLINTYFRLQGRQNQQSLDMGQQAQRKGLSNLSALASRAGIPLGYGYGSLPGGGQLGGTKQLARLASAQSALVPQMSGGGGGSGLSALLRTPEERERDRLNNEALRLQNQSTQRRMPFEYSQMQNARSRDDIATNKARNPYDWLDNMRRNNEGARLRASTEYDPRLKGLEYSRAFQAQRPMGSGWGAQQRPASSSASSPTAAPAARSASRGGGRSSSNSTPSAPRNWETTGTGGLPGLTGGNAQSGAARAGVGGVGGGGVGPVRGLSGGISIGSRSPGSSAYSYKPSAPAKNQSGKPYSFLDHMTAGQEFRKLTDQGEPLNATQKARQGGSAPGAGKK
jgi:hypothetical protein